MLIATWNVNSIRTRLTQVLDWLEEVNPDLLCLQETKVDDKLFPEKAFKENGYQLSFHGQKSYNGVALISRHKIEDIRKGFVDELNKDNQICELNEQKRIISALIEGIRIINIYVPNGNKLSSEKFKYKIKWLNYLKKYLQYQSKTNEPLCLLGDFNIAPDDRDIHNPKKSPGGIMASPEERLALQNLIGDRLEDVFRIFETQSGHWSWWDYRNSSWERDKGWRIDQIYLSKELLRNAKSCEIHKKLRGNVQPSDHVPVVVDINWPADHLDENFSDFL